MLCVRATSESVQRHYLVPYAICLLLAIHAGFLAWGALRHSPSWDEMGHLPAGLSHLQLGRFDLYRVNPPLVRMVATIPIILFGPKIDWHSYPDNPYHRPEWDFGRELVKAEGEKLFWYFTMARWACIPFSILGAWISFRWAQELYGRPAGLFAATLWCFCPNLLANAQMITPDTGATALGLAATYAFFRWLKEPNWPQAMVAGAVMGLAELTKFTWIILFPLWPLLWLAWRWPDRHTLPRSIWIQQTGQLLVIFAACVYLINAGYGFERSCDRLGNYVFVSQALTVPGDDEGVARLPGNRFAGTWLAELPIPVPKNYLLGIDRQNWEFETGFWSYLAGEWRFGGWWYYYLYALAIKVPLGTWLLLLVALGLCLFSRKSTSSWRNELMLLTPIIVVLTLASLQTGFNHHMRYVLPIFPFVFIWISKVARVLDHKYWAASALVAAALAWSLASSLWVFPHSLSYFNELVGGPKGGHAHLHDSNIDWGQDLLYLKQWLEQHPESQPIGLAYSLPIWLVDPKDLGIDYTVPPYGVNADFTIAPNLPGATGPMPGWYAICVRRLRDRGKEYEYFLQLQPVAMAGYSIYIYHITLEDANRVRAESGLPMLTSPVSARKG